jgi:membrane-bound lytic murein transglycosylase D
MPRTGRHLGLTQDSFVDERIDPEEATRAAAQYLKYLRGRFDSWEMALAAYNAGEGNVRKAIARHGTDDFWELSKTRAFSKETRNYFPKIYAAILMARDPARYGLDVRSEAVPETATVKVKDAVDLRVVAEYTNTDLETLRDLNPELRRNVTPVDRAFELTVPADKADIAQAKLEDLPSSKQVRTHVIKRGQTLSTVARRYGTSVGEISRFNAIGRKTRLKSGTELLIPPASLKAD